MKESKRILLVEDSEAHAKLTKIAFSSVCEDYELVHLQDGQQAIDWLSKEKDNDMGNLPRFILLDLNIPTVSGMDVLKNIKNDKILKLIPVIVLTTSSSNSDIKSSYDLSANSYIVKPLVFDDFLKLMETLRYYWIDNNKSVDTQFI